jgi:hypothetical protein
MKVDLEEYHLDSITDYDQYIDLKPPENLVKKEKDKKEIVEESTTEPLRKSRRNYRKCTAKDKEHFFEMIYEEGLSISQAAKKLGMPV